MLEGAGGCQAGEKENGGGEGRHGGLVVLVSYPRDAVIMWG